MTDLSCGKPSMVREEIRKGIIQGPTAGFCRGYAQGNLVVLPKSLAYDFLLFAHRNPKPCPILEVTDVGEKELKVIAASSDITTDIPKYRVYRNGQLEGEYLEIQELWRDDFVAFVLGCSFTFESALIDEKIPVRHIECGKNVPMYITNIECKSAGVFSGPMVVSMRPIPVDKIVQTVQITSKYPRVHGAPVHIGNPKLIGIKDIDNPDFGDSVEIKENEIPVFWACGVTPQAVAMKVKPKIMITHAPGHMYICDIKNDKLASL
ncbi:putative hydro-lyase [Wukongibacter sp. M2B1]|uniref:putative hydro-lyase n=1 Tax=Wukongibacter sp. M2B1 TaxID=3088895 RepID=UPI003D7B2D70